MYRVCSSLVCIAITVSVVGADPPSITRVYPPGIQRGSSADLQLIGKPGNGRLQVWSESGELSVEIADKQDAAKFTAPADSRPGLHWLRFYNESGAADLCPFVVGVIPEVTADEPHNDISTAQAVEPPSVTVNGILQKSDDVDVFAMSVRKGRTLVAAIQANNVLGSPMDAVLQLLDSHGTVIAHNDDDHGLDPQISFLIPADGTYFVRTFAFPAKPNSTVRLAGGADYVYRLTITTEAFIDHVVPAVVDRTAPGSVKVHGWNLTDELRTAPVGPVDGDVAYIAEGYANAYQVSAGSRAGSVEAVQQPQQLTLPVSVTGCISQPDEHDVYSIVGKKGQKLTVRAASRVFSSLLDPVVTIADQKGKILKESDDISKSDPDSEAALTLSSDGTFTVTITDRFGGGGERFFYTLTCTETQPDFAATVKANAFVLPADKPLEIPVAIARNNGFAEKLSVSVTGLPDGVTVAPVDSAKAGDTAKSVKLTFVRTDAAKAFTGPFRIVCTAESGLVRSAAAPIQNSTATTENLWLTVVPRAAKPAEAKPE